jgi:aldose 1-epimerase
MIEEAIAAVVPIYFGILPSGEIIWQYKLRNKNDVIATVINYGATLTSLSIPTANSRTELTIGFDTVEEYISHPFYAGCTVGRVANRIAHGQFSLDNNTLQLAKNENHMTHLHGGEVGFDKVAWTGRTVRKNNYTGVEFSYFSPHGEENYPGNLLVKVTYILTDENELILSYIGETDLTTPLNLTNHAYWNLNGAGNENILNHEIQIFAGHYLPTDDEQLPTGEIRSVAGTDFDFEIPARLEERVLKLGGFDHCFTLDYDKELRLAARAHVNETNRSLEVYTTETGLEFYTGNSLPDYHIANNRKTSKWGGFCFETQGYPDAVNQIHFPSIILTPDKTYQQETIYKIGF